jgi:site-specific DNA-methyltransferase (adenine-specific)
VPECPPKAAAEGGWHPGSAPPVELRLGDAADILPTLPAHRFGSVIADPPHELGLGPWDVLPSVGLLGEILRVLKPGAFLVLIADDRTSHLLIASVERAGFTFLGLDIWVYASGRARRATEPRIAFSPIIIARAPGRSLITNVDEARIPWKDDRDREQARRARSLHTANRRVLGDDLDRGKLYEPNPRGRHPTNVLAADPVLGHLSHIFVVPKLRDPFGHPAGKPADLFAQLARLYSPPGTEILDPFCGAGPCGVAALAIGRPALLSEKEPNFHAMAERNIAAAKHGDFRGVRFPAHSAGLSASDRILEITRNNEELQDVEERARVDKPCRLVTAMQMAEMLHISVRTLRRRVRDCAWPCVRIGSKTLRFEPHEVLAAAAKGERRNGTLH